LKFQAVAEKTAKDARGLLYFAAPGIYIHDPLFSQSRQGRKIREIKGTWTTMPRPFQILHVVLG